jgi:hypothetical protein
MKTYTAENLPDWWKIGIIEKNATNSATEYYACLYAVLRHPVIADRELRSQGQFFGRKAYTAQAKAFKHAWDLDHANNKTSTPQPEQQEIDL